MIDPIADFLTRIKNAYQARKSIEVVPFSKMINKIAQLLVEEGFLSKVEKKGNLLHLFLKYENKKPALHQVERISKSSLRIYAKATAIPRIKSGLGITLVSTSKGIMTDKKARYQKLGGEIIAQVG